MIFELKKIIQQAALNQEKGLKNVLASVVYLEGSSYRKPGVRMLLSEDHKMTGAVSGGCVEKEICRRAQTVFNNQKAKIITYDGRYRLGCEGILYILIEPFYVSKKFLNSFLNAISNREPLEIQSFYIKQDEAIGTLGSFIQFKNNQRFTFSKTLKIDIATAETEVFVQHLKPIFKLLIIGGEHDAIKLCAIATQLGWEVEIIASEKDPKKLADFPGANSILNQSPENANFTHLDGQTAIVIMTHSYVQDLKYLLKLQKQQLRYIGILGASNRRERLFNDLFDFSSEISDEFLESIYTPAGLNLGAETPEEIALSIVAEILAITKDKKPFSLRNMQGKIHSKQ